MTSSNNIMYQTCDNYFYYKNISPTPHENQNNHENTTDCPICFNKSTDIIIFFMRAFNLFRLFAINIYCK